MGVTLWLLRCCFGLAWVLLSTLLRVNRWAGKVLLCDEGYVSSLFYYIHSI